MKFLAIANISRVIDMIAKLDRNNVRQMETAIYRREFMEKVEG
jgi:hypothetical protein